MKAPKRRKRFHQTIRKPLPKQAPKVRESNKIYNRKKQSQIKGDTNESIS